MEEESHEVVEIPLLRDEQEHTDDIQCSIEPVNPLTDVSSEETTDSSEEIALPLESCRPQDENILERIEPETNESEPLTPRRMNVTKEPTPRQTISQSIEQVQTYLTTKILENQCSSHAQEIHQYLTAHWSPRDMERHLPFVLREITTFFETQAQEQGQEDLSLEIQSSLCMIEQMFLTVGRASPLQDMYTEEEQELINSSV